MSLTKVLLSVALVVAYAGAALVPCEPLSLPRATGAMDFISVAAAAGGHGEYGHGQHGDAGHDTLAAARSHGSESAAESTRGDCHQPPSLAAPCGCGCDQKSRARAPGSRLGPALLAEARVNPTPAQALRAAKPAVHVADGPMLLPEPIPI